MILDILAKEGFIFLSNRVHPVDRRDDYLKVRDKLVNIYLAERQEKEKCYNDISNSEDKYLGGNFMLEPLFLKPVFQEKFGVELN